MSGVVGLDLSLTGTAACWCPRGWGGDTSELETARAGRPLKKDAAPDERARRMAEIADAVVAFVSKHVPEIVVAEDHAFGMGGASATETREMTGVVKVDVWRRCGLAIVPVNISSARKTLLQKLPRKDVKSFVELNVRRLGGAAPYWTGDEVDAFVVMNHGAMLVGGVPLSFLGIV